MAALNFPSTPSTGQAFDSGSSLWQYDGVAWRVVRQLNPESGISFTGFNAGSATVFDGAFFNVAFVLTVAGGVF